MPNEIPDLILFGCDGVLVDSEPVLARASEKLLAAAGIELSAIEIAERFAGRSFKDMLFALERESGTPVQASMIDRAESYINDRLRTEARATEGAKRIAAAIPRRAIASNASRQRLAIMLEASGLAPLFEGSAFSVDDTQNGRAKPAPDVLLLAAERMKANPAHSFVIEDTADGVQAAIAAGMRAIGYTGASHSIAGHADLLTEAGAETVINRWSALAPVLAALSQWRDA